MIAQKIKLSLKSMSVIDNWWDYLLDYSKLKKGDLVLKINGKKIKIRAGTNDKRIVTEVALVEPYFPKWLNLPENATVVDLGAHIGLFSILASSKYKCGKIYAIEPSEDNFRLLSEQIKVNGDDIIPLKLAVSDKRGQTELYKGDNTARFSIVIEEGKDKEVVETVTLQDLFDKQKIKKCDLLKIDIEGGEYAVLYSTPQEVFDKVDRIFLSLHEMENQKPSEMVEFLKKKGFKINANWDEFVYATK